MFCYFATKVNKTKDIGTPPIGQGIHNKSLRYFIEVSYLGQAYHGWQVQRNAHTIQKEINDALEKYCRNPVETVGSGRTDRGVHAIQQFCHLDLSIQLDVPTAVHKINAILPTDIAVINIYKVPDDAHARFHAISRSYQYRISRKKDPFAQDTSFFLRQTLDVYAMNEASKFLIGEMDFKSFSRVKTSVEHFICTISQAHWEAYNGMYCFYVSANRFLRGMVRSLVGTLIDIGTGKLTIQQFQTIIKSEDRRVAGRSVPAHGLFLTKVVYPKQLLDPA